MPIWGRKRREALEALSSAKNLIIKVKKKGINTSEAETLYKEAKKAIKNRRYSLALEGIEEAKKSAKRAYAKGIKERLKLRASRLSKSIDEMQLRNLDTRRLKGFLKEAEASLKGEVKDYKHGLKAAREGLKQAEDRLEKFNKVSGLLASIGALLRRMEDRSPNLKVLDCHKESLSKLEKLKSNGKIKSSLKEAEKLHGEVKNTMDKFSKAYDSIKELEKVVKDGEILEADIDDLSKLHDAEALLIEGEFKKACKIADNSREDISTMLKKHKDAKYHVDMAMEKVLEVKNWGFSAFEAERPLNTAKEALRNQEFEKAIALSKESKEKAGSIRARHKRLSELIRSAREKVDSLKAKGVETSDFEQIISEAENEFYKGDYGASEEIIDKVFEMARNLD